MIRGLRNRTRSWIGLSALLGLMFGSIPVAETCLIRAAIASGCHVDSLPVSDPATHGCCRTDEQPATIPPRAFAPIPAHAGADGPCRTRTASCCCVPVGSQTVAERSARSSVVRAESQPTGDLDEGTVMVPRSPSNSLLIATGPPRPGPSRVPIYLRTARLRN